MGPVLVDARKAKRVSELAVRWLNSNLRLLAYVGVENPELSKEEARDLKDAVAGLSDSDLTWLEKWLRRGGRVRLILVVLAILGSRSPAVVAAVEDMRSWLPWGRKADDDAPDQSGHNRPRDLFGGAS